MVAPIATSSAARACSSDGSTRTWRCIRFFAVSPSGTFEEEHPRTDTVGIDDRERPVGVGPVDAERVERLLPGGEPCGWLLDVAEHFAPDVGELAGTRGVDGDLNRSCHRPIIAHLSIANCRRSGRDRFPTRPRPPSVGAMGGANAVVEVILKSPLHRVMSGKLTLIRYQGSRTGTEHTLPVQYADTHGGLVVVVGQPGTKTWWRNFTTMGQTQVLLKGSWVPMTAHALVGSEDPEAVTPLLRSYATRFPKVAKSLQGDTLEERVEHAVVVWLRPAA